MNAKQNKLLQAFVLQGYSRPDGKWASQLSPLKNAPFSIGDFSKAFDAKKPFLAQTDAKGLLHTMAETHSAGVGMDKKLSPTPVPYHFVGTPNIFSKGETQVFTDGIILFFNFSSIQ